MVNRRISEGIMESKILRRIRLLIKRLVEFWEKGEYVKKK